MKLAVEEFERVEEADPLTLFNQGIKAEETREKYTRMLRLVLCRMLEDILRGSFEERAEQLVRQGREDPAWARDLMLSISRKMRERTMLDTGHPEYLNPASFPNYFKPLKKLLDMNDVMLPWKRVYSTFPPEENASAAATRGWEHAEIRKMLRFCRGPVERAIILVCASSGIRIGGFGGLQWRDLEPVYRKPDGGLRMNGSDGAARKAAATGIACAKLQIYRGSPESYPAFITPEAYEALLDYREEWASRVGRDPRPSDPMFIKAGDLPRRAALPVITNHVLTIVTRAGLRVQRKASPGRGSGCRTQRHEVPMMNGFRRFWNKACKESLSNESPLAALIKKEYMMGHAGLVKLDRNYFKAHVLELAAEYVQSVPALTIGDEERLLLKNAKQAAKIGHMQDERDAEIAGLRRTVEELARRMESMRKGGGAQDGGSKAEDPR